MRIGTFDPGALMRLSLTPQTRGQARALPGQDELPERYSQVWDAPFRTAIEAELRPDTTVLDLGSGRNPTILPDERPPGTTYIGLDLSAAELAAAPPGSYDERVVADTVVLQDHLIGRTDLIVSWQVLEHVPDLGAAVICIRSYLSPGGAVVAMFSGSRSAFAVINRIVPFHVGAPIVSRVMGRTSSNPVFPAYYDRCHASALRSLFAGWSDVSLTPFFAGAGYFGFSRLLSRAYLAYEDQAAARGWEDLATHYLLVAHR